MRTKTATAAAATVKMVRSARARKSRYQLVTIDVAKFDARYERESPGYYIDRAGNGRIGTRYENVGEFLKTATEIDAPEAVVNAVGGVGFGDGRHRYAYLRDNGAIAMTVSMSRESAKHAATFGLLNNNNNNNNNNAEAEERSDAMKTKTATKTAATVCAECGKQKRKDNHFVVGCRCAAPKTAAAKYHVSKNGPREYTKESRIRLGFVYTGLITTYDVVDTARCSLVNEYRTKREATAACARLNAAALAALEGKAAVVEQPVEVAKPATKRAATKRAATKRTKRTDVIQEEYLDSDGYWIYLKPGYRTGQDPVGCLHQIVEDTKRAAYSWLANVLPCDCADCQQQPGYTPTIAAESKLADEFVALDAADQSAQLEAEAVRVRRSRVRVETKKCRRCRASWVCRSCGALCCEHRCSLKTNDGTATCGKCQMQPPAKPTAPTFTAEERELIQRAALRVWEEIGGDCLQALDETGDESVTIDRDTVIELACDAGRLEDTLRRGKNASADLIRRVSDAGCDIYDVIRPAFKYEHYGF